MGSVGQLVTEDEAVSHSAQLLGWAVYGKWEKVKQLVDRLASARKPIYSEVVSTFSNIFLHIKKQSKLIYITQISAQNSVRIGRQGSRRGGSIPN